MNDLGKTDVFVIADTDGNDLVFRIASASGTSPLQRLPGKAGWISFNPFSVYGQHCADWVNVADKFSLSITVASVHSGSLAK